MDAALFPFVGTIQSTAPIWFLDQWRSEILEISNNGVSASLQAPA
jgi:hypothetical protein